MDKPVLQEEYKGYVIKIWQDEMPENPREWDNIAHFYFWHRHYDIGDKHSYSVEEFQEIAKKHKNKWFAFPVTMYDHSGIGFSLSRTSYPFNCPWDSMQVGWIIINKSDLKKNFPKLLQEEYAAKALEIAQAELDVYNDHVQGNVYGYEIIKPRTDECITCKRKKDDKV